MQRALKKAPAIESYDLAYLERLKNLTTQCPKEKMLPKLDGYSSAICKFAEGKLLSNISNVGLLANNISAYEKEINNNHDQAFYLLWDIIVHLSMFYHQKEKP